MFLLNYVQQWEHRLATKTLIELASCSGKVCEYAQFAMLWLIVESKIYQLCPLLYLIPSCGGAL